MLFIRASGGDDDEKTVVVIINTRSRHYHLQDRIGSLERPGLKSLVSGETLSPSPQVQPSSKKITSLKKIKYLNLKHDIEG